MSCLPCVALPFRAKWGACRRACLERSRKSRRVEWGHIPECCDLGQEQGVCYKTYPELVYTKLLEVSKESEFEKIVLFQKIRLDIGV